MDHFSPSYFALLGPLDQAKLAEQVISEPYVRILRTLAFRSVRCLLAGEMALTLHGIPRLNADLCLFIDQEESNLKRFVETLESEGFNPDENRHPAGLQQGEVRAADCWYFNDKSGLQIRALLKNPVPFAEAFERGTRIQSGSMRIELLSLKDLIL